MTPDNIQAAFTARQMAVASLRELADETEGREMTAEETQTYERQNADIDALDARIQSGLKDMKREQEAAEALEDFRSMNNLTEPVEDAVDPRQSDEELFRQLVNGEIRSFESYPEQRDLTVGTATAGGNLVTSTLFDRVLDIFTEEGAALRAGATLIETESGNDMLIPVVSAYSTGAKIGEGSAITESDPSWTQKTLSVYKYAALVQISSELLQDQGVSNFNVMNFVGNQGGAAVARALSTAWSAGDGTGDPEGFNQAGTGLTTAAVAAVTTDELMDLQHSITEPYRQGSAWVFGDSTIKSIRQLKDTTNQYIWQPGMQAGSPDVLLGAPVYSDPNISGMSTGSTFGVYGNFERGYMARIAGGVRVESSNAPGFANDLESIRFIVRGGGCLTDSGALKKAVNA